MTKKRLSDICVEKYKFDTSNKILNGNKDTGFIIDKIMPTVRDDEEFKEEFMEWMDEKHFWEKIAFTFGQMLLGYELEFIREILEGK